MAWPLPKFSSALQIEEVAFRGSDTEFISLVNTGSEELNLAGWSVGDAEVPGDGGEHARCVASAAAGRAFCDRRNGAAFQKWHTESAPNARIRGSRRSGAGARTAARTGKAARWLLNDSGDEVILLDPSGRLADAVAYGDGDAVVLGLSTALTAPSAVSLQRVPGFAFPQTRDPRLRFLWARPDPFDVQRLPDTQPPPPLNLPDGLLGVVGTMGVSTTFSPDGLAPPHRVALAAAQSGLHFAAMADVDPTAQQMTSASRTLTLPSWRWQGGNGDAAVIYGPYFETGADRLALLDGLTATGALAQWMRGDTPDHANVIAVAADNVDGAADAHALWRDRRALLLAGNTLPPLPGYFDPSPRYTGLAVDNANVDGALAAMRARRGWLTSDPNTSLTLRTESGVWMGSIAPLTGQLSLVINYQDGDGEIAGVALWQDGKPLSQLDVPPANGEWRVTVPAAPNGLIYAVATQIDGDFAVTMPLRVTGNGNARVWINEVMPIPLADFNGDGVADTGDEYVEFWNAGPDPISLAGWQLADLPDSAPTQRRLFTLGPQHFLDVGAFLVIWGKESFVGLNNSNERLALFDAAGQLVDVIEWSSSPGANRTFSRVPDGGRWDLWGSSPGRTNGNYVERPFVPTPPAWEVAGSAAPGTPGGEAVGPLGSVTQAKLAGLGEPVRFVGVVTAAPGLFNAAIYVADAAAAPNEVTAAVGVQVYLRRGDFPSLAEGDRVDVQGVMDSFRGEREIRVERPEDIWRVDGGAALLPLRVRAADIGEKLEGRLVTFEGIVSGFRGSSFFLADPDDAAAEPVEIHVRSSLPWRRPYVVEGDRWRVTGIVGQFALEAPWNGGYRVLARYEGDLVRVAQGE
ncbi:MAG: lamin tail domain-containing protein [Caldilineaceae bacterium]